MCEIISFKANPVTSSKDKAESMVEVIFDTLYDTNNDGLGLVAIYVNDDTGKFEFEAIKGGGKGQRQNKDSYVDWLHDQQDAWRIVAHARLATAGGVGFEQTHPITVVDDDVDSQYVIHNGVVYGARTERQKLTKQEGHTFNTTVDSEVIAHKYPDIPETLDDDGDFEQSDLSGNLNWLLFAEDGILVRNSGKYTLTGDLIMTCRPRWIDKDRDTVDELDLGKGFALFTPDTDAESDVPVSYETRDIERRTTSVYKSSSSGSRGRTTRGKTAKSGYWSNRGSQTSTSGRRSNTASGSRSSSGSSTDTGFIVDEDGNEHTVLSYGDYMTDKDGDRLYSFGRTSNGFTVTIEETESGETELLEAIVTTGEGTGERVPKADIFVTATTYTKRQSEDDGEPVEYDTTGHGRTNKNGTYYLTKPPASCSLSVKLIDVPDEYKDDDADNMDIAELDPSESSQVAHWTMYTSPHRDTQSGFCNHHGHTFQGGQCNDCLLDFTRDELLSDDISTRETNYTSDHRRYN